MRALCEVRRVVVARALLAWRRTFPIGTDPMRTSRVIVFAFVLASSIAEAATVTVTLDLDSDRRAIDPAIYGVSGSPDLSSVAYPFVRWGGNSTTRYNWQADVHNTAGDWFYMNIVDGNGTPSGSGVEALMASTLAAGSRPLLTLSTIGWTPLAVQEKRWSYSVIDYGPQLQNECSYFASPPSWCTADAGNGRCSPSTNTTGHCNSAGHIVNNDPARTSQASPPSFQRAWIAHLQQRFGTAAAGGVRDYALDNEPMLWNSTHRDVHPQPLTYDEIWERTVAYGTAIKQQDPAARVFGPVTWGYCDLFGSAADNCVDGADRAAHGGTPFVKWYLERVCAHQQQTGVRLVDYLDIHYYPQAQGVALSGDESGATAARRLRSLKELHDPAWASESWIADLGNASPWFYARPQLIRRARAWIDEACPGTKLAITEYNWGADNGASSALAQAELLSIFAREGVDAAARWVAPLPNSLVERAFRLYLDYDGQGRRVEGVSVRATSADSDTLGSYAVQLAGQRVMVLLFNKATTPTTASIALGRPFHGTWRGFRFSATSNLQAFANGSIAGSALTVVDLPARSATIIELPDADRLFANGFESP